MATSASPLVSVVMPVYNGEEFIADAIRSVLAQSYTNWDMTIGNNWSKDRTLAIAQEFAAKDSRIRVVTYPKFVSVVESHNNAFGLVSLDAKYCKLLSADDLLFPNCLEEMVKIAEANPTVGMVASYVLTGGRGPICEGPPYPSTFMSGREVVRLRFTKNFAPLAGPSQSLIRASILRSKKPFYNPVNYHGDTEAYLELLQEHDLGFVHQILTFMRTGEASRTTSYLGRVQSREAAPMDELSKFGRIYLTEQQAAERLREARHSYYRFLGSNVWEFRSREFWDYHLRHVKALGYSPDYGLIAGYAFLRLFDMVGNPLRTIQGAGRRLAERRRRRSKSQAQSHGPAPTGSSHGAASSAQANAATR